MILKYREAISVAFLDRSTEIDSIKKQVQINLLIDEYDNLKSLPLERKADVCNKLSSYYPTNKEYARKSSKFNTEIERIKSEIVKASQRKAWVNAQFSQWDGSHKELEKFVKKNLNDPDSYEHVDTRFTDNGKYLTVVMKYRANNAFGGKVVNYIKAKISQDNGITVDYIGP